MQSVIFTPPVVNLYVRESLAALQYKRNCDRFGMFFLDKLEVENRSCMIEGILGEDDNMVKGILGPLLRKPRSARVRRRDEDEEDEDDNDGQFPIGPTPTWKEITASIESDPTILIPRWVGLPKEIMGYSDSLCEDGSMQHRAGLIFVKFTRQLWISLNDGWRVDPDFDIEPESVEEALKTWTVDFVLEHCAEPLFRACAITGLQHVSGRHVSSFGERIKLYFPSCDEASTEKGNFWKTFGQEPGYLHDYWETIKEICLEEGLELQKCLEELLEQCQCLPDSSRRSQTIGRGWNLHNKRVVILTNPNHYQIREVGEGGRKGKGLQKGLRSAPAHRSEKERYIRMLSQQGYPRETAAQAVKAKQTITRRMKRQEGRSKKAKNKRVPPKASSRKEEKKRGGEEESSDNDQSTGTSMESTDVDDLISDGSGKS
jgi:hypothetical protein